MKISRKFSRTCANVARNSSRAVASISRIACEQRVLRVVQVVRCVVRKSRRFCSSSCSSIASGFTGPSASSCVAQRIRLGAQRLVVQLERLERLGSSSSSGFRHSASSRSRMVARRPDSSV